MHALGKILPFIRPFRRRLLMAFGLTGAMTLMGMVPPILTRYIIDDVVALGRWERAPAIFFAFLAINFLAAGGSYWNHILIYLVGQRLVFDVRMKLFRHIQGLSLRFYEDMGTGKIMSRIMSDVSRIQEMVTWNTISIVNDIISFGFGIVMIFYFSWKLSIITLCLLPLYMANYLFFVKRIRRKNVLVWRGMDRVANQLQERLRGTRVVRSFGNEERELSAFATNTREVVDNSLQGTALGATFSGTSGLLSGMGYTVIYCLGCYFVIVGQMTYGDVAAFGAFVFRVLQPAVRFTEISNMLEQTSVSVDRIFEVLETDPEIQDVDGAPALERVRGDVRFRDVHFHYVEDEPVLKGVDLEIHAGSTVALVGHTGCGKTTMMSLLVRFYDPQRGAIEIDGKNIAQVQLSSLRRQVGAVLQDSILFNASVCENLLYADPSASFSEIIAAAKAASIHEFIMSLEDGYDTHIGEGGVKLSVGEKQRMSIARAILTDPTILIMDEATSSLDSRSESLIQEALENVMAGRTTFIIAHRLATIVKADLIVVVDHGEIIEKGPHAELLKIAGGSYRQLYEEQFAAQLEGVSGEPA